MAQERKPSEEKAVLQREVRKFLDYWNESSEPFLNNVYGLYDLSKNSHSVFFLNDAEYSFELDARLAKLEEDIRRLGIKATVEQKLRTPITSA